MYVRCTWALPLKSEWMLRSKDGGASRTQRIGLGAVKLPAPRALVRRTRAHPQVHREAGYGALVRPYTIRQRHRLAGDMHCSMRNAQERRQRRRRKQRWIGEARIQGMRRVDPYIHVRFGSTANVPV